MECRKGHKFDEPNIRSHRIYDEYDRQVGNDDTIKVCPECGVQVFVKEEDSHEHIPYKEYLDCNMNEKPKVTDYLDELMVALREQLEEDYKRWGDTWLSRSLVGQDGRMEKTLQDYYDKFTHGNQPVPQLKIIGGVMINWIRENHPELQEFRL